MQNDFYLLEDSPEAKDMREHIHNLLMSHDETNHELALQLIEGGGMHPDFTAPLVMHTISLWWSGYSKKGISTVKLLKQTLSIEELTYLRTSSRGYYWWNGYLEKIIKNGKVAFWKELAKCVFYYTKGQDGNIVCLHHNLVPSEKIFEQNIYNDRISFYGYYLTDLPDGLANIEVKNLNFLDNYFTHIRRKKWTNAYVEDVEFEKSISPLACYVLAKCFPTFSQKVINEKSKVHRLTTSFMKCVPTQQRDMAFYTKCATLYKNEGNYRMALKIYAYLHKTHPYPEEIFTFKIAGCYALLKNKKKMLEYLALHLQENTSYMVSESDFLKNNEFRRYWKIRDVGKLFAQYNNTKNT